MIKTTDYANLGFECRETHANYISYYKDGKWDEGMMKSDDCIKISAFSPALHYGQEAFEGLKAYRRKDGKVQLFRPDMNAKRLQDSCKRLLMPDVPVEKFIDAVEQVVKANEDLVPPYGSGATLYVRPFIIGVGRNLGVRPAKEYIFSVICSPVGSYFKGGLAPNKFVITEYDRAAPNGTGNSKVGGNYAASLYPHHMAKEMGYADCIYLDPLTHTKIDEVGAANFFGITYDNKFITPKSSSILPSITKKSLMYLAEHELGLEVVEGEVYIDKLDIFKEAGACGTAAVISPIGRIDMGEKHQIFFSETEVGPTVRKLYDLLTGIQYGDIEGPEGWTRIVK
ncbi:MAG: branched-chain amino acid aminotransferase [Bacilli bacterium]|nr:branched-chain amino acid aminotransferase [Bacilli bacterium]MBN2877118.1 branched-chain amino acid aminotransferase [Bacilli bacterium]